MRGYDDNGDKDLELNVAYGNGEWITPAVSYVDPSRRFCDLCGRPIARRFWQVVIGDATRIFCDPSHADLNTTYPRSSDV